MFSFRESKAALFPKRGASSSGIDLRIRSFLSGDFTDSSIVISMAWWTFIEISWSGVKSPVAIKISSFLDCSYKCSGLRSQKHHLLIEGAVEIVVEGKHLGNIFDFGTAGMLAPFLVLLVELSVPHLACMHLGDCLYLCLGWYELFLKSWFKISPCSVVDRCLFQGSSHKVTCPFSSLCSLLEVSKGHSNFLICSCVDGLINGVVVLKCVSKGEGPVSLAIEMLGWCSKEFLVDLCHDGYCGYWCTCLGCCS